MTRLPDQRMPTGFALVTSPGTDFRVETRINQTFPKSTAWMGPRNAIDELDE